MYLGSCLFLGNLSEFSYLFFQDESSGRVTDVFIKHSLPLYSHCGYEWLVRMYIPLDDKESPSDSFLPSSEDRDKNNNFNVKKHTKTILLAKFLQ